MTQSARKNLSNNESEYKAKWQQALADAKEKLKSAEAEYRRFKMTVATIQDAITRGEPWPTENVRVSD